MGGTYSAMDLTNARSLNAYMWEQAQRTVPLRTILGTNLAALATGSVVADTAGRTVHTVQIAGTFSATVNIMGCDDDLDFVALEPTSVIAGTAPSGANITTPGIYVFRTSALLLRADVTAYTSGTITEIVVVSTLT